MNHKARANHWTRLACLALALSALGQAGCLVVAAGVAGGAAAGYCYAQGKLCQTYRADILDSWLATRTALADLGMPLVNEKRDGSEGCIETRTGDGDRVRIFLESFASRIPAEGTVTRICVRVATFGDHPLSSRILEQVSRHLVPSDMVPGNEPPLAPTPAPLVPTGAPPVPVQPQTSPPPLLSPQPIPEPARR
jgi:hypothetical protein